VSDTKLYRRPESLGPVAEIQTRVPCRARSSQPVLDDIGRALREAEARESDPLIILEDLGLLQDSVATLIKGVSRLLVGYSRTVTFWESSGYTEAFLSVMDGPTSDR
jgi:hypothetical protein